MHRLKDKIWREIDEIADKPKLSAGDLETLGKLVDVVKDIDTIAAMEDGGYSEARHYVRGHYSRDAMGMHDGRVYDGGYPERRDRMGRYARDGGHGETARHIEAAMETAGPEDREMLERLLNKMR